MSSTLRRIATAALAIPLAVGMATSADAKSKYQAKSSGNFASAYWERSVGTGDGATVYTFGGLEARGDLQVDVFGWVDEFTCPDPVTPFEDPESECSYEFDWIYADPSEVTLTMGKKNASAQLTGTVLIANESGETEAELDVTFEGFGATYRATNSFTYRDSDGVRFSVRSTDTGRSATVSGSIGEIDLAGAEGSIGTYRQMEREMLP